MGFWIWWIKKDTTTKLYGIYAAICFILGFGYLFIHFLENSSRLPDNIGWITLFIVHPVILVLIWVGFDFIKESYIKYKQSCKKE